MSCLKRSWPLLVISLTALFLAGCGSPTSNQGGYYKDDGPGSAPPGNIQAIPNPVPRIEPHYRATKRSYVVFGKRYTPMSNDQPFKQEGTASWYGRKFHGNKTANGEIYDMYAMTAAHPTLPIPSYARVTRVSNGKSVIVRVNDRGPFHSSRVIDLSYVAAAKLELIEPGSGRVIVEAITHDDIRQGHTDSTPADEQAKASPVARNASKPVPQTPQPDAAPKRAQEPVVPDALLAVSLAQTTSTHQTDSQSDKTPDSASPDALQAPGLYLQFGAFSNPENAQKLANRVNAQLAEIKYKSAQVSRAGRFYRVQLGPYSNRTQAVNAAIRIQNETGTQPTIAFR